jgi:phosphohistidine phosphatase SixA
MKLTALAFAATLPLLGILPPHAAERSRPVQDKVPQQAVRSATVIFLRHAEALPRTRDNQNPDLAKAGEARAKRWQKALRAAGVTKIFATELVRTQQTAAPLAAALGLKLTPYRAGKSRQFADSLRSLEAGQVAVVCGHSNTVPQMVERLGGQLAGLDSKGYLQDTEHDRMIVQTLAATREGEPMRAIRTLDLRVE